MKIKIHSKSNITMKWLLIIATASLLIITLALLLGFALNKVYATKYLTGIHLAGQDIGGKSKDEAHQMMLKAMDNFKQQGLTYEHENYSVNIQPSITTDKDILYELITYDLNTTLEDLWHLGHEQGYTKNFWEQIIHLLIPKNYYLFTSLDKDKLLATLKEHFSQFETQANNARPEIISEEQINILPHNLGVTFNYQELLSQTEKQAKSLILDNIKLNLQLVFPTIQEDEITEDLINSLKKFISEKKTIALKYKDDEWIIKPEQYNQWLEFYNDNELGIRFDYKFNDYIKQNISPDINQEPSDAKFSIADGRVVEFQQSKDGQELNIDATIDQINSNFFSSTNSEYTAIVTEKKAKINIADSNSLGIREIIGIGKSNFKGSPANRVHNIKTGASAVNGSLIKPGEIFSLITVLGEIEAKTGYLPELVIKGDKTVPEYGGGLCQIGTTTFRGAIDSGLDIVERRNHSYRVSYYEPAGTDATIYSPKPDFRFKNDTGNNILIQTRIEGTELIFEFWGTKDNRIIEYSEPRIYNITKPGPTKIIETTDLAPGEKKCTEKAHNGADAEFDYKVTYADGEISQETFKSHYVPWPEVCMVGIDPAAVKEDETNNSTDENIEANDSLTNQ